MYTSFLASKKRLCSGTYIAILVYDMDHINIKDVSREKRICYFHNTYFPAGSLRFNFTCDYTTLNILNVSFLSFIYY